MRVLVGCEMTGEVRDAFKAKGHDAWSCDLKPSKTPGNHLQCDIFKALDKKSWDMFFCFPPCTHISVSGALHFEKKRADGRQQAAVTFFLLMAENLKMIGLGALENPVGIMSTIYRRPDQTIQPYNFGEDASKATCLWLCGLPLLKNTSYFPPRIINGKKRWSNQCDSGQNRLGPSPERGQIRSNTYPGIAAAMADQWTNPILQKTLF